MSAERVKAAMTVPKALSLITNKYSVSHLLYNRLQLKKQTLMHSLARPSSVRVWLASETKYNM